MFDEITKEDLGRLMEGRFDASQVLATKRLEPIRDKFVRAGASGGSHFIMAIAEELLQVHQEYVADVMGLTMDCAGKSKLSFDEIRETALSFLNGRVASFIFTIKQLRTLRRCTIVNVPLHDEDDSINAHGPSKKSSSHVTKVLLPIHLHIPMFRQDDENDSRLAVGKLLPFGVQRVLYCRLSKLLLFQGSNLNVDSLIAPVCRKIEIFALHLRLGAGMNLEPTVEESFRRGHFEEC